MDRLLPHSSIQIQTHVISDNKHDQHASKKLGSIKDAMLCDTEFMKEFRFLEDVAIKHVDGDVPTNDLPYAQAAMLIYSREGTGFAFNEDVPKDVKQKNRYIKGSDIHTLFEGISNVILHVDVGNKELISAFQDAATEVTFTLNDNLFSKYDPAGTVKMDGMETKSADAVLPHTAGVLGGGCADVMIEPGDIQSPLELLGVKGAQTWSVNGAGEPQFSFKYGGKTHVFDHYSSAKNAGAGRNPTAHAVAKYAGDSGQVLSAFLSDGLSGHRMFWSYDRLAVARAIMAGVDIVAYEMSRSDDNKTGPYYLELFFRKDVLYGPTELLQKREGLNNEAKEMEVKYAEEVDRLSDMKVKACELYGKVVSQLTELPLESWYTLLLGVARAIPTVVTDMMSLRLDDIKIPPIVNDAAFKAEIAAVDMPGPDVLPDVEIDKEKLIMVVGGERTAHRRGERADITAERMKEINEQKELLKYGEERQKQMEEASNKLRKITKKIYKDIQALQNYISRVNNALRSAAILQEAAKEELDKLILEDAALVERIDALGKHNHDALKNSARASRRNNDISRFEATEVNVILHAIRRFESVGLGGELRNAFNSLLSTMKKKIEYMLFVEAVEKAMEGMPIARGKRTGKRTRRRGARGKRRTRGKRKASWDASGERSAKRVVDAVARNCFIEDEMRVIQGMPISGNAYEPNKDATDEIHINYLYNVLYSEMKQFEPVPVNDAPPVASDEVLTEEKKFRDEEFRGPEIHAAISKSSEQVAEMEEGAGDGARAKDDEQHVLKDEGSLTTEYISGSRSRSGGRRHRSDGRRPRSRRDANPRPRSPLRGGRKRKRTRRERKQKQKRKRRRTRKGRKLRNRKK